MAINQMLSKNPSKLQAPIYQSSGHKYEGSQLLEPPAQEMKSLQGPLYDVDSDHHFSEIIANANILKDLHGPIYQADGETKHQFREMTKHVESLLLMAKPVMVEEGKHGYGEQNMAGYGEKGVINICGPIYVKEFSKHNYQEKPKEDHLKQVLLKGKITHTFSLNYLHPAFLLFFCDAYFKKISFESSTKIVTVCSYCPIDLVYINFESGHLQTRDIA